ncbi:RNA-binding protein [Patescibacteria group bacterium]|nr:RNA-binding protein [Patescibacteria group bacterium]MBU1868303.1 RNA-binding protein [Patescibacteria group bacterium]
MAKKLFIGGLSWDTTEDQLREFFAQVGTVTSAVIITDKYSGKSKGFGFVEMSSDEEALEAITKLNSQTLDNRTITVGEARPQAPRRDDFRGGGGGGGSYNRGDDRRGQQGGRGGGRGGSRY